MPARLPCLLLAACALGACPERHKGPDRVPDVARVHDKPISLDQLAHELAFERRTSSGVLPQTDEEIRAVGRIVLEDMIDRMLLLEAAQKAGIDVPADKVEREVLRLKAEYHGSGFNEALAEGHLSQQELRERTRSRLTIERYFREEIVARVAVTDAEIEAYYAEHVQDFAQPEQVRAAQILVKSAEEARRVLGEIRRGMSFDEAARRWSLAPDAKVGGDLGFFARGIMPPVFDQICFSLAPRQVSEVAGSEYGFHLFKVLDRRAAERRPLAKVRGEVEKILVEKKREEAQRRALLELRAGAEGAARCRSARPDGGPSAEEAIEGCLKREADEHITINEAVLAQACVSP